MNIKYIKNNVFYNRIQWNISSDTKLQHISENMHGL